MSFFDKLAAYIAAIPECDSEPSRSIEAKKKVHLTRFREVSSRPANKSKLLSENFAAKHLKKVARETALSFPFDYDRVQVIRDISSFLKDRGYTLKPLSTNQLYNSTEIKVRLLKDLQGGIGSQDAISQRFGMTRIGITPKLNELANGTDILGSEVRIKEFDRGTNNYDSTIHPIFLALNLYEVYALTIGVMELSRKSHGGDPVLSVLKGIAEDAHRQLSDYGSNVIDQLAEEAGIEFSSTTGEHRDSYESLKYSEAQRRVFLLVKSSRKFSLTYAGDPVIYEGYFSPSNNGDGECVTFDIDDGTSKVFQWDKIIKVELSERM